jgi:hypothetical protein
MSNPKLPSKYIYTLVRSGCSWIGGGINGFQSSIIGKDKTCCPLSPHIVFFYYYSPLEA